MKRFIKRSFSSVSKCSLFPRHHESVYGCTFAKYLTEANHSSVKTPMRVRGRWQVQKFCSLWGGGKCSQPFQVVCLCFCKVNVCWCVWCPSQRIQCARSQQRIYIQYIYIYSPLRYIYVENIYIYTHNTVILASINTTDAALWTDTPHRHTTLFFRALNNSHCGFQNHSVSFVKAVTETQFFL